MKSQLTIGDVLKELGVTHFTLRDWDRRGILPAKRNEFGWRIYDLRDVLRIKRKIKHDRPDHKKLIGV